ncbi:hypothetical protein PS1_030400 [Malus domestica]
MNLRCDMMTRLKQHLTVWKSPDDPSPGDFIWETKLLNHYEPCGKGSNEYLRSSPWNGLLFCGKPTKELPALNLTFVNREKDT